MAQTRTNDAPIIIGDLRGGRNDADAPLSLSDDQCQEALNVDWYSGTVARKRGGASSVSLSGGSFAAAVGALIRHVPGLDETAAELWGMDTTGVINRLAGGTTWAAPTLVDSASNASGDVMRGVSFGGFLYLAYDTTQNRLHLWDGTRVRRVGLATPDPPTGATLGGSGKTFTRYYRIRTVELSGSTVVRRSEPSTSISVSISDDSGVQITRPTLPTSEHETHWEVEYADASTGPWYRASQVATATTTYDDTAATISTTNLSNTEGIHFPPPSAKYLIRDQARLVMAGSYETSGGFTLPKNNRVWWTPPTGALDVGDGERIPNAFGVSSGRIEYGVDVEAAITGLGPPIDGDVFVFAYRTIWGLTPTTLTGANAYRRYTLRTDIGCIRDATIVMAEDERGNPALYFLSHKGPYRIGSSGVQYCGNDIETLWATINLGASNFVAHGVYHSDKHQIWWFIATGSNNDPDTRIVFDTRLGRASVGQGEGDAVVRGWAKHTGNGAVAFCSVMFSNTLGASMSRDLKPYIGQSGGTRVWKCDTGTDDAGTNFQAYVETKPYMPGGFGVNHAVSDGQLVAKVGSGVTITVTPISDFGLESVQTGTALLTAAGSETRVQKRLEGLQAAGKGAIAFRIGDASAASNTWEIDAVMVPCHVQESRT